MVYQLVTNKAVDTSQELVVVLEEVIQYDNKIHKSLQQYVSIIMVNSFVGDFLLGLAYQG